MPMNPYQKTAVFVVRILGSAVAVVGMLGPVGLIIFQIVGLAAPTYPRDRWATSFIWLVGGITMVLASKPIGRRLGAGLD